MNQYCAQTVHKTVLIFPACMPLALDYLKRAQGEVVDDNYLGRLTTTMLAG